MSEHGDAHRDANQAFFDRWAPRFEGGRMSRWFQASQARVLDRAGEGLPSDGGALLDVGCGTGWLVREAARRFSGLDAVGVDLSPSMVEAARTGAKRDGVDARFVESDSANLPFDAGSFDVITCTASFHHYPDPVGVMRRWHELLRPGGRFLLLESCTRFPPIWLYDRVLRVIERGHVRYYPTPTLLRFGREAGFQTVSRVWRERGIFVRGKLFSSLVLIEGVR